MVTEQELTTIELDPESELAKALATSGKKSIILVSNGRRYSVSRDPLDPVVDTDRETFEEALRAVIGTLTQAEGERLKQNIYRWREEGTRPPDRR